MMLPKMTAYPARERKRRENICNICYFNSLYYIIVSRTPHAVEATKLLA